MSPYDTSGTLSRRTHDLADCVDVANGNDVEAVVENDFLAPLDRRSIEFRMNGDAHLATVRHDVERTVVVATENDSVPGRRLGELLHFLAESRHVIACLAQGERELLVVGDRSRELPLGLEQPLLERPSS